MALRRKSKIHGSLLKEALSKQMAVHTKWRLSCVRCKEVVNPHYYMICKENSHFLCGKCAWLDEPRPSHYLCCDPVNLHKGPTAWLENLLDNAKWHCVYKENGCKETPNGREWKKHAEICIYKCDFHCFYKDCEGITHGVDETIKHYKEKHLLTVLKAESSKIKLDLMFDRCEDGVKRRLMLVKDDSDDAKYYIVGTEVTEQDFNIFIWDCSQKENYKEGESGRQYELVLLPFPGYKPNAIGQMTYNGVCQPMEKTPEAIIESAECFSIGLTRLMKKYLGTFPGCAELDLCKIVVSLQTKGAPNPEPQLPVPVGDDGMRLRDEYVKTLFPSFPPHDVSRY